LQDLLRALTAGVTLAMDTSSEAKQAAARSEQLAASATKSSDPSVTGGREGVGKGAETSGGEESLSDVELSTDAVGPHYEQRLARARASRVATGRGAKESTRDAGVAGAQTEMRVAGEPGGGEEMRIGATQGGKEDLINVESGGDDDAERAEETGRDKGGEDLRGGEADEKEVKSGGGGGEEIKGVARGVEIISVARDEMGEKEMNGVANGVGMEEAQRVANDREVEHLEKLSSDEGREEARSFVEDEVGHAKRLVEGGEGEDEDEPRRLVESGQDGEEEAGEGEETWLLFGLDRSTGSRLREILEGSVPIGAAMCEGTGEQVSAEGALAAEEYLSYAARAAAAGSPAAASSWLEAAQRAAPSVGTLLAIASQRVALSDGALAAYLCSFVLSFAESSAEQQAEASRLLALSHLLLAPLAGEERGDEEGCEAAEVESTAREEVAREGPPLVRLTLESELSARCDSLASALEEERQRHESELMEMRAAARQREGALEGMLAELTATVKAEMSRCAAMQPAPPSRGGGGDPLGLAQALQALPPSLYAALCVEARLSESGGDVPSAAPALLLGSLELLTSLQEENMQLSIASQAVMAAQADAVRKLAASNGSAGGGGGFLASSNFLKTARRPSEATELARKEAQIAELRRDLEVSVEGGMVMRRGQGSGGSQQGDPPGQLTPRPAGTSSPTSEGEGASLPSFERMKAELAPLLAELSRAGQAPHAEELHELWEAALFFTADKEAGAVKLVEEHLVWRRRSPYPGVADVDHIPAAMLHRELSCGLVYVRGADREGRSVIVFNVNKHTTSSPWYDKKRMLCAVVFVIEQALYESRHNRQFVLLCNLRGFGMRNFDQYLIGRAFRIIFHNYPKTMHACLLANAPVVFNAAWAILRTWIPPALADAFHFVDDSGVTQFVPQPPAEENDPIRIAPYMGLMVGHLRHARGASSSVNPALTPPALPSVLPSAPASSLPSPLPSASPSAPRDPTPPPSVPNPASAKSHSPSLPSPSLGPVAKAPPPEPNLAPSQLSATTAASAHASVPASLATPTPTPLAQPPPPPPPKPRSPDESEPSAPVATAGCEGGGESRAVAVEYV
ncbi:MAG: hypothetical protein SGPRY_013272, partial [Prymnesium sp.]